MYISNELTGSSIEVFKHLPGVFGMANAAGQYVALNQQMALMMGYRSAEEFIVAGGTNDQIKTKVAEVNEYFNRENARVLTEKKPLKTLVQGIYDNNEVHQIYGEKHYIEVNGEDYVFFHHHILTDLSSVNCLNIYQLLKIIHKRYPKSCSYQGTISLENYYQEYNLTERQTECLYLLSVGKYMREIAELLDVSRRTVESHVETLKNKLNCHSKSELIEKALADGLLTRVPEKLLHKLVLDS